MLLVQSITLQQPFIVSLKDIIVKLQVFRLEISCWSLSYRVVWESWFQASNKANNVSDKFLSRLTAEKENKLSGIITHVQLLITAVKDVRSSPKKKKNSDGIES